ncbi:MAG: DUF1080 domain-containing protein [Bacteroidales bacterium]|nr:DUF1080 domain-containing protein [Bacteroidales bacterium]
MKTLTILSVGIILLLSCVQANNKEKQTANNSLQNKSVTQLPSIIESSDTIFTFENSETGKLPQNWSQYATGRGKNTDWKIVDDNGNKVLAQLSKNNPNYHFNDVVFNGFKAKNVELSVKIKGFQGKMGRGGGFIWRFTDRNNYYVVRANPLEDNVVLYKVKDGKRTDLPIIGKGRTYGIDVKKLGSDWNILKLTVVDDLFTVYLNGEELFKVKDETFTNAEKIGLWTKADAVSYFDDFKIKILK